MAAHQHLTGREVERLLEAVNGARHEARDRCLLLLLFRHGLHRPGPSDHSFNAFSKASRASA